MKRPSRHVALDLRQDLEIARFRGRPTCPHHGARPFNTMSPTAMNGAVAVGSRGPESSRSSDSCGHSGRLERGLMRFNLQVKLLPGFGVVLILMGIVGGIGTLRLASVSQLTTDLYEKHTLGLSYIMQANADVIASGGAKRSILAEDRAEAEKHAQCARKFLAAVTDDINKYKTVVVLEETKKKIVQIESDLRDLSAGREQVLGLAFAARTRRPLRQRQRFVSSPTASTKQ